MESTMVTTCIDLIARALEATGVAVIGAAFLYAAIRGLIHFGRQKPDAYQRLKIFIGKALQLGLEFLVAADIIATVTITPTRQSVVSLALLVLVRTFLSWSITLEDEGCWPWQIARNARTEKGVNGGLG
jgi:uncharacterized membrane protein